LQTKKITNKFRDHSGKVTDLNFSPLSKLLLISVSSDRAINFYDVSQRQKVNSILTRDPLTSVCLNSDGRTLAVGTSTSQILLYDLRKQSDQAISVIQGSGHKYSINQVTFKLSDIVMPSLSKNS